MQNLVLNQTPIRTSKSYKINNIKLNDVSLPTSKTEFNNIDIKTENIIIENKMNETPFVFGNSVELENNLNEFCNNSVLIKTKDEAGKAQIVYTFDDDNTQLSNYIEIIAEHDVLITLIYKSTTENFCHHNSKVNICAQNGANVHVELINFTNSNTNHFKAVQSTVGDNSKVDIIIVDMGAKNSISNIYTDIIGKKAEGNIDTVYIANGEQLKDINYISHLKGKKCSADINVQGALLDNAKKNFKGTIDFKKGCKRAKGSEQEYCMLLSDEASSIALPMLLCTEDDVEGSHSAASGQADAKQVFYLMSRGFSRKEAIKLLVKAKYFEILQKIKDENLQNMIIEEIDRRLA